MMDDPMDVDEEPTLIEEYEQGQAHSLALSDQVTVTHNHYYHGPINYVGQVTNSHFGTNYGLIAQAKQSSTTRIWAARPRGSTVPPQIQQAAVDLSALNPILDASHTRDLKVSPPHARCLPGTRKKVIATIYSWAMEDLEAKRYILWVFADAGCGKSAITQALAEQLAKEGRLGASFFFFRDSGDRSKVARFAATLARQLADSVPGLASIIGDAIKKDPSLVSAETTSLSRQFEHLIYRPIMALAASLTSPVIIVLDGVDECEDRQDIALCIESMIAYFQRNPSIPLRFVIASRTGNEVASELRRGGLEVRRFDLAIHTSKEDMEAILHASLSEGEDERALVHKGSPSTENKEEPVKHVASRPTMPVAKDGPPPTETLPPILSATADFDDLYTSLLEPLKQVPHSKDVISTVALAQGALSISQISDLLEIKKAEIVKVLTHLQSVIQVPGDGHSPVTMWHTSLRDFLTTEERSGPFFAAPTHHRRLAYRCIALAQDPLISRTPGMWEYARCFGVAHLAKYVNAIDDDDGTMKNPFGEEKNRVMRLLEKRVYMRKVFIRTGLEFACRAREWKLVKALVHAGIDVNVQFEGYEKLARNALHLACYLGEMDMVMLLLDKGADPDIACRTLGYVECWSAHSLPIIWAVGEGHIDVLRKLLECGANPDLRGGKLGTALHGCVLKDRMDMARMLLENGASPNIQNGNNDTPLHIAGNLGKVDFAELLLSYGANTTLKNNHHYTPLCCTRKSKDPGAAQVVEVLLRVGAKE